MIVPHLSAATHGLSGVAETVGEYRTFAVKITLLFSEILLLYA